MEWLTNSVKSMERSSRTVASNANKVVQRMQNIMNDQDKRIKELESSIGVYHTLCLDSLQSEINRLELRKKDLLLELETTDEALIYRKRMMENSKIKLNELMNQSNINTSNNGHSSSSASSASSTLLSYTLNSLVQMPQLLSNNHSSNSSNDRIKSSSGNRFNNTDRMYDAYDVNADHGNNNDNNSYINSGIHGDNTGQNYGNHGNYDKSASPTVVPTPLLDRDNRDNSSYDKSWSYSSSKASKASKASIGHQYRNSQLTHNNYKYNNYNDNDDIFSPSIMDPENIEDPDLEYIEEIELLATIRDMSLPQQLLFILQRSNSDDIIAYTSSKYEYGNDVIQTIKLTDSNINGNGAPELLSSLEHRVGLSSRLVPNHEREFPDVISMGVPLFAREDLQQYAISRREALTPNRIRSSSNNSNNDENENEGGKGDRRGGIRFDAQLLGVVEIPVVTEIVIDIWETTHWQWATTTINGVKFAVLERIFISCDVSADDNNSDLGTSSNNNNTPSSTGLKVAVIEIHLFGRHPQQGHILNERIMVTSGY